MRSLSSKLILTVVTLMFIGFSHAQEASYPTWKHELQDLLGLEQSGKADRATFEALVAYLDEIDMLEGDEKLEKGYDGMGGYLGFQIYLDNNQEWLLDMLRYEEDEGLEDIEAEEEDIFDEEEEEDLDLDLFGEEEDDEMDFDDSDIDISGTGGGIGVGIPGMGNVAIKMHSIGFDVGMYGPSMSYWNDEFINDAFVNQSVGSGQTMTKFAMGPLFQGSTTFKLGSKIRISLSGGMWSGTAKAENLVVYGTIKDTVYAADFTPEEATQYEGLQYYLKPNTSSMTKDLSVSITPLTAMLGYELFSGLYVGVGMGTNRVTQKITDDYIDPDTGSAVKDEQSYTGAGSRTIVCVGYEMPLGPLTLGLQGQYVLGKYMQEVSDGYGVKEVEVGTDGIQFLVNLGYSFGE